MAGREIGCNAARSVTRAGPDTNRRADGCVARIPTPC